MPIPYLDVEGGLDASYAMNLFACSNTRGVLQGRPKEYHWQNQMKVKRNGDVPLFLDAMWRGGGPHWDRDRAITPPDENGRWYGAGHEMKHFAMDRHGGGVNVLFMDGHARKVRCETALGSGVAQGISSGAGATLGRGLVGTLVEQA